jgi:zinc resistance-associated protein
MKKHLLLAATAALLAFSTLRPALALEPADPATPAQPSQAQQSQAQQSEEDRATLVEARIAALKAGLKLTAAQEKDWDSLEKVLREVVAARNSRKKAFWAQAAELRDKDEVIQGMKLGAKALIARGEDLDKIAEAATPLFSSLDAAQKHRFGLLLRSFAGHPAHQ